MRIAICDQNRDNLIDVERIVNMWRVANDPECEVECFDSRSDFMERHRKRNFDILFLDTGHAKHEGMDFAKNLREEDKVIKIAFMSKNADLAVESYKVHACQYFLKPISQVEIKSFLNEQLRELGSGSKGFVIKEEGINYMINFRDIIYVEALGKYLKVHVINEKEKYILMALKSAEKEMISYGQFYKPHRSYIVSLKYVTQFSSQEMRMVDGSRIPIARGKANDFKEKYLAYVSR